MRFDTILYVRLPCNPIFPIGVVYLSDFIHKQFPQVEQRIFDMGTFPPLDFQQKLFDAIDEFQPDLLVYSWRDMQVYAPVNGRAGNPLQNAFEFYYAKNPLKKIRSAWGSLKLVSAYYGELW
ncbi:MAG: radical SAM protein, partial [Cyanobacteria bacterium J06648_11]